MKRLCSTRRRFRNIYKLLVRRFEGKWKLARHRHKREDIIKIAVEKVDGSGCLNSG
jgi:hypothetical protein